MAWLDDELNSELKRGCFIIHLIFQPWPSCFFGVACGRRGGWGQDELVTSWRVAGI